MTTSENKPLASGRFVIAGTSGTGKTALLQALAAKGFVGFEEPGRKILDQKIIPEGEPFAPRFIELMLERFVSDFNQANSSDINFFDRGFPDAVSYCRRFDVNPEAALNAARQYRYHQTVFLAPIWREIFQPDQWRNAPFEEYVKFHSMLVETYQELGYVLVELPKGSIDERIRFIEQYLQKV